MVASVDLGGFAASGHGVVVIDGAGWFPLVPPEPGESGLLVRVDPDTNQVDRILDAGPEFLVNDAVVAGGSLWVSIEGGSEVWRFALDTLGAVD